MRFPLGNAALCIALLALGSGAIITIRGAQREQDPRPDLVFATFAKEHADAYRPLIAEFEQMHGVRVQLQVVDQRALQGRLQSALQVGAEVPDMVELIDGSMGVFTKGPVEDVGFIDLTDRLHTTGLFDRLVTSRFSKWSSRGHIFALPHDVHPVVLCYRKDIVEQLGIDVNELATWDAFARVGREVVTKDLDGDGSPDRYMIDLPSDGADQLQAMILQHGGHLIDASGDVAFDSEAAVDVVCWYVRQVQGTARIGFPCGWGQNFAKAMSDGLVLFYFCPDWRTRQIEMDVPQMSGKLALMPLPAWEPGGLRTSTWGGTGLAFTKRCRNFDLAWQLAMHLYYDPDQLGVRFAKTNILPPLKDAWAQPQFAAASDYWSGASLGKLFIPLAQRVPDAPSNAYQFTATGKLSQAFTLASLYYAEHGERGLREYARAQLKRCADEVRRIMDRNRFLTPAGDRAR